MNFAKLTLFMMMCAIGASACSQKSFELDVACVTQPQLSLKAVRHVGETTEMDFVFESQRNTNIGVHPPGHVHAYYAVDFSKTKKWHLVNIKGIAIRPNKDKLRRGDTQRFTLIFERITKSKFHLIEGKEEANYFTHWHFMGISLE